MGCPNLNDFGKFFRPENFKNYLKPLKYFLSIEKLCYLPLSKNISVFCNFFSKGYKSQSGAIAFT